MYLDNIGSIYLSISNNSFTNIYNFTNVHFYNKKKNILMSGGTVNVRHKKKVEPT